VTEEDEKYWKLGEDIKKRAKERREREVEP